MEPTRSVLGTEINEKGLSSFRLADSGSIRKILTFLCPSCGFRSGVAQGLTGGDAAGSQNPPHTAQYKSPTECLQPLEGDFD